MWSYLKGAIENLSLTYLHCNWTRHWQLLLGAAFEREVCVQTVLGRPACLWKTHWVLAVLGFDLRIYYHALQMSASLTTCIRCCIWEGGMCTDRAWPPCMFVKNTLGFSCSWLWPSKLLPCFADECTHGDTFLEPTMQNNTLGFKLPRLIDFSFEPWVPAKGHAVLGVCQLCGQSATTFVLSIRVGIGRNTPSQVYLRYAWADGRQDQGAAVLELSVSQTNQPHIHVL